MNNKKKEVKNKKPSHSFVTYLSEEKKALHTIRCTQIQTILFLKSKTQLNKPNRKYNKTNQIENKVK